MATKSVNCRWSIISALGLFFCFFLFPVFVINASLTSLLELKCENHKQRVFHELSENLKKLAPYSDERHYFHLMLQKNFELAETSSNFTNHIGRVIKRLKKNYPGQLEFIVWDKNGQTIDSLTDEKRFRFVLKKLWEVFSEVTRQIQANENTDIKNLPIIKSSLNLIKHFLGRVFLPESLALPHLKDGTGTTILADYGKERPYFWYHTGKNGGILCFLTWDVIKSNTGLKKITDAINRSNPAILTGFASLHNLSEPYLTSPSPFMNQVIMALARYETTSEQQIDTDDIQTVVQVLNPHIRTFAIKVKTDDVYRPDITRALILTRIIALYLLLSGILYLNFNLRKSFFSIRWRLLFLFIYANMAPMIVLGTIAYDYLQNKTIALKNDIHLESARLLRDIDQRFSVQTEKYTSSLNEFISSLNRNLSNETLSDQQLAELKKHIMRYNPDEFFLIENDGEIIYSIGEGGKSASHSITYVKNMADAILKYHNGIIVKADKSDILTKVAAPEHSDFIRNSIRDSRKIWPISIGDSIKVGYWNLIGDQINQNNRYFIMLLWNENSFQNVFINNDFKEIIQKSINTSLFAMVKNRTSLFPPVEDSESIQSMLMAAAKSGITTGGELYHNKIRHIATAMACKTMNQTTLLAMVPAEQVDSQIRWLEFNMLGSTLLSLAITIIISLAFSRQFLSPIKELGEAAKAVARHNFRHRINNREKDEFGQLAQVMNRMIEGLGELEVARIVQESLLPEEMPEIASFEVFGKTNVMTALGGDYFDFIQLDEENFGVIIGDVAGHGISAALIMAMAKAGVKMSSPEELRNPATLLNSVHQVLISLKGKKLKRMMTFQYLVINQKTGRTILANAGHCYPLLIDQTGNASYIEQNGPPLGIIRAPVYTNFEFTMQPQDRLVLFTDGIVEAQDKNEKLLDYSGLLEIARNLPASNAENAYTYIFNAYLSWAGELTDDMTLVVIRRRNDA